MLLIEVWHLPVPHKEGRTGSKLGLDLEVAGGGEGIGIVGGAGP